MRASQTTSLNWRFRALISEAAISLESPVKARKRWARRRRIASLEVSGMKRNMRMNDGPAMIRISQRDQRHPRTGTAYPDKIGPTAGAQKEKEVQTARAYGKLVKANMSCMEAGAVARQGEPKKPWRKRRKRSPPMLWANAVGTQRITNKP